MARHVSFFRIALLFAVLGQSAVALILHVMGATGLVDFVSADPNQTVAFNALTGVFVLQIVMILIALARIGLTFKRAFFSVASLIFALAMLMLCFVFLQCDLYGACL
ncbi:MAG: hypothetical protein AB7F91_09005 [Parvularculaceae bacterium]